MKSERAVFTSSPSFCGSRFDVLAGAGLLGWLLLVAPAVGEPSAKDLLRQIGVTQGICALPGDRGCSLALSLARESELLCYVQLADAAEVEAARRRAFDAGLYGTRIFVERGPAERLHLADNVADALIAPGLGDELPVAEALRVVHPQGRVLLGARAETKPFPPGVDDWTHPYHGPDNNPVSNDKLARGPYLTQFLADPRYAPLPQVAVSAAGGCSRPSGTSPSRSERSRG